MFIPSDGNEINQTPHALPKKQKPVRPKGKVFRRAIKAVERSVSTILLRSYRTVYFIIFISKNEKTETYTPEGQGFRRAIKVVERSVSAKLLSYRTVYLSFSFQKTKKRNLYARRARMLSLRFKLWSVPHRLYSFGVIGLFIKSFSFLKTKNRNLYARRARLCGVRLKRLKKHRSRFQRIREVFLPNAVKH